MDAELQIYREQSETPFDLGGQIGTGPYVVVRTARERGSKTWPYAQKTITLNDDTVKMVKRDFIREVNTLRYAQHHHVVEFVRAFAVEGEEKSLAVVMNRASGGSMQDYLTGKRRRKSDLEQIQQWFGCLASVVDYIHGIGIRHRDIKPANILVHDRKVRLADFGISQMGLGQTLSTTIPEWARRRTAQYCAPEVDQGSSRGRSADIFSLGAVFLEMLVAHSYLDRLGGLKKKLAFDGSHSYSKKIPEVHVWMKDFEKDIERTPEDDWRRQILSIAQKMLHEDRDDRPKAFRSKEIFSSPNSALPSCDCSSPESMKCDARLVETCKDGDESIVRSLVTKGTSPATIGAIHQASARGYSAIVGRLLDSQVDVNLRDHSSQTALHCAAGNQRELVVDILLRQEATVTLKDAEERTPMHHAAGSGNINIVRKLLDKSKPQFDIRDNNGQTALHFAAKRGHDDVVQGLLEAGADPRLEDSRKGAALHFAAGYGSEDVVKTLLGRVDLNAEDADESTALHFAAKGKRWGGKYREVMKLLLQGGVDPMRADSRSLMAFYYAKDNKSPGLELLRKAMQKAQFEGIDTPPEES